MEGQDKHHRVSFASVSGKQVEAAFDGGLPLAQAGITRRRIWSNSVSRYCQMLWMAASVKIGFRFDISNGKKVDTSVKNEV